MKTIIHVNQHKIKSNRSHGENEAVLTHSIKIPDNYYEFAALYKRLFFTWIATGRNVVIPNQVAATMQKMNEQHPYWVVMADDEIVDDLRLNNDMNAYNIRDVT